MQVASLPPGPSSAEATVLLLKFRRNPLLVLEEMARRYGDIVHLKLGKRRIYFVNNPNYIKDVLATHQEAYAKSFSLRSASCLLGDGLVTSEDPLHARQRKIIQPAFHERHLATVSEMMGETTQEQTRGWKDAETLDVNAELKKIAMTIMSRALFGRGYESESLQIAGYIESALGFFTSLGMVQSGSEFLQFPSRLSSLLSELPHPSRRQFDRAKNRAQALVADIILRHAASDTRGDLLAAIKAQARAVSGGAMDEKQLLDEVITLLASFETTGNALSWALYLLAAHPVEKGKLQREVDGVLDGRTPTYSDIQSLRYANMVFAETLRLFPPVWLIARESSLETSIGAYGVPARSTVMFSPYIVHRDPRFHESPRVFYPGRWEGDSRRAAPRFSYIPFGGGMRGCVGEPFAWIEGTAVLANICKEWDVRPVPGKAAVLLPRNFFLRPKNGIWLKLVKRAKN